MQKKVEDLTNNINAAFKNYEDAMNKADSLCAEVVNPEHRKELMKIRGQINKGVAEINNDLLNKATETLHKLKNNVGNNNG